ncbi:MAG: DNA polymerase III subunit [Bacteroidaceae bacterium]|nr:DNA polymerase III subunit [Bacteroidaceae bacterium]
MYFKDVIGQETIIQQLIRDARNGTVPHALLFAGPEGTGKMQTALAFANYLLCDNRAETDDACCHCPACVKTAKLIHPDLHFAFPVVNRSKSAGHKTVSDDEIARWREFILSRTYFGYDEWLDALDAGNSQAMIYTDESDLIAEKLRLTSSQGGYKIVIIWQPEKMHITCANKMLKLLEEPPAQTVFMLVSDHPEQIIETIISRTQRIDFPPVPSADIARRLQGPGYMLDPGQAADIAHICGGSWLKAIQTLRIDRNTQEFLDLFIQMMRLAYGRKIRELKTMSEDLASRGREWQKDYLSYCQRMVRENFISNLHRPELVYMTPDEESFSSRFSPFVNERNISGITFELSECQRHIEQNVNAKMVFFDFILKLIILLKQ